MDSKRLTEIEERCTKATTGEWITGQYSWMKDGNKIIAINSGADDFDKEVGVAMTTGMIGGDYQADADFIAHARTDLPDLVAAYKLLRADAAELARALKEVHHDATYRDCGCAPCRGQCRSKEALETTLENIAEASRELLSRPSVVNLLKEKDQ